MVRYISLGTINTKWWLPVKRGKGKKKGGGGEEWSQRCTGTELEQISGLVFLIMFEISPKL